MAMNSAVRPKSKNAPLRRLGILGSPQGPYVRQLVAAARSRSDQTEVTLLSFADMSVALGPSGLAVTTLSHHSEPERIDLLHLDGVIVRTMPLGSLEQVIFRMDALQSVHHAGVPILNPPKTLEIAIDKWLTQERLTRAGLATPPTWTCQTRSQAMEAFETLGRDVVVKPIFGGEGRGIVRLSDADMAWRIFGSLQQVASVLYVQQFIPNFGYDIRVLIVGQRLLSVKRRAPIGGWRTNISQGSIAEAHELSSEEEQLAWSAAEATGGTLLGVDLLPAQDGRTMVLEINAVPGWAGTSAALGANVAEMVIEHLEELNAQRT